MYLLEQESSTKASFSLFEGVTNAPFEVLGVSVNHIAKRRENEDIASSLKFDCVYAGTRSLGAD